MTDPEDGDQPARPAYGPAGPPPPPPPSGRFDHPGPQPYSPSPYSQPPYGQQPYGTSEYGQYRPYGYAAPGYGQPGYAWPAYGQQSYGGYAPPVDYPAAPAPRRPGGRGWALIAVVVAAVAIGVVLSLTLHTRVLSRSAVERDVAAQFEAHEGVAIRLVCAGTMALTRGATYPCQGTTADGEKVTLLIRVTDAGKARYTWTERR